MIYEPPGIVEVFHGAMGDRWMPLCPNSYIVTPGEGLLCIIYLYPITIRVLEIDLYHAVGS
ncbi:MAG: hypothetical protein JWP78_245 [Mucilaginibacter sp.]|nr:hypothetical protein [Mucilaginibacter sp.]